MRTRKPVPVHNLKVTRKGKVKKRSVFWRSRRVFYLAALAVTVFAAGLVYVLGQIDLPVDPRVAAPQDLTSFICSSEVQVNCNASNAMAQLHGTQDRVLVTYAQIPPVMREAVLSAEDHDFFKHGGVDPMGIARAAAADLRGNGVRQGGSTITQQYVKQAYLTSEQTATRKIKEAVMAVKLEQQISKQEILTRYLNTVYFGRGAYGVQAASRVWFDVDVEGLNAGQAAFLAGLLRNPNGADPYKGAASLKEAERRRRVVVDQMQTEGYITLAERKALLAISMDPNDPAVPDGQEFIKPPPKVSTLGEEVRGKEWGSEYFAEYVRQWLVKQFGADAVYTGGLKVYTTLDLNMQKAAYDAVTTTLDRPGDPSAALVALDDGGQVKAMMGGTDFANNKVNLATGKAGGGSGRQPGSTFKMFALAEAVREGYSIQSVLPSPSNIEITDPICLHGEPSWKVRGGPGGSTSLVNATKKSINTVYAQLMVRLGPDKVLQMARDMGVAEPGLKPYCALVLGGGQVSVLDMAAGYSTVANNGIAKTPIVVTRVEFPNGDVKTYQPVTKQVLDPDQAGRVNFALQQVIKGGTGVDANFGRPAAGKTGTTQSNVDGWFVGFTPKLTAAVWMGYPSESKPMNDVHGIKVQGGTFPARIWKKFMENVTASTPSTDFPEVSNETLAAGITLDPKYGTSRVITGSSSGSGTSGTRTPTTRPHSTSPTTTVPGSSVPQTSVPHTTVPPATVPPTTKPVTPTTKPATPAAGAGTGPAG